ncbi:unnamed protein product [Camellia sinensis]
MDRGDDQAAVLNPGNKPLTQLLFKLNRPFEVASRGYSFIIGFSKALALHESMLPFCMCEVWVITACLALINTIASHYSDGQVAPDIETEFFRLQDASLSMLPWPKPAVWPLVPPDASSEVFEKEKMILQTTPRVKHFGIQRKPLPLEPSLLLREANRQRASLSAGNVFELFDGRSAFIDGDMFYLVDAYNKERFSEAKKELDALLSDDSLANVPFLILGNKIDIPYAASEDELRYYLGLTGVTTGKGNVDLADSNVRPIEVFMCSIVCKMGYGDGFKWLSQYIK